MIFIDGIWQIFRRFLNLLLIGVVVIICVPFAIIGLTIEKAYRVVFLIKKGIYDKL